ncbi:MAG: diguanylate cyclase [Nitrospiraceae bacterium]|nr:diguanylate cyclase [Nitrospiraceae bacterium]
MSPLSFRHPALWLICSTIISLAFLAGTLKQKKPGYKAGLFCCLALLLAGLSLLFRESIRFLLLPLAVAVTSFFGPEVFLPLWGALPVVEAKRIFLLHQYGDILFVLSAAGSAAVAYVSLRHFKAKTIELRQKLNTIREDPPGVSSGGLDLKEAAETELRSALNLAKHILGAGSASLFQAGADELSLRCSTARNPRVSGEGLIRLCYKKRQPVAIGNIKERDHNPGYSHEEEIRSMTASPLMDGDIVIGVLAADSPRPDAFAAMDTAALSALSLLFAGMLKRQRVHGEMDRNLRGFEVFRDESSMLLKTLDTRAIAQESVRAAMRIAPAMGAALFLIENDFFELKSLAGIREPGKKRFQSLRGSLAGNAMKHDAEPLYLSDIRDYSLPALPFDAGHIKAVLMQPLVYEDEMLGVLAMVSDRTNPLTVYQIELIRMLSNQLSVMLSRAILHERIRLMATTDGLTGLYNHRHFQERLAGEFKRLSRHPRPLSLLLVDIDFFKKVNDTYGHPAGDAVLKLVASIIKGIARDTDIPARYGGEEFAALLMDTDKAGAAQLAERLRRTIAETPFPIDGGNRKTLSVSVSIGVASFPADAKTKEALIEAADKALYRAKHEGRNRVVLS